MTQQIPSAVYAWALRAIDLKPKQVVVAMRQCPTLETLLPALKTLDGAKGVGGLAPASEASLESALPAAWARYEEHLDAGITPIGLTDEAYSPLLAAIQAPSVLFARGNLNLLGSELSLAVVGTRHPARQALEAARRISAHFAGRGACIVSGLAIGIDTAAHVGALEASGATIAVLANPLDTVHPASNRSLAGRILDSDGLILSELSLGADSFPGAFVRRDRIQSGLSAAVVPVQTSADGGTMHTARFAVAQGRWVLWPRWPALLLETSDFSGNREALERGERTFSSDDYEDLERELRAWPERLRASELAKREEVQPAQGELNLG